MAASETVSQETLPLWVQMPYNRFNLADAKLPNGAARPVIEDSGHDDEPLALRFERWTQ